MIKKILVANRGEIAVRIIKTCKELNIETVAIYSKCDKDSYHVFLSDEAYCVGDNDPSNSYLNADSIIQIAIKTGCRAIHPGYGFLSEDFEFAKKVIENNLIFIGPSLDVMNKIYDKQKLKDILKEINVPLIDSYKLKDFIKLKDKQVYPVLIKQINGGGGKGIKKVSSSLELEQAIKELKNALNKTFDIDNYYVEKYIDVYRHIEVQAIADKYNNISILPERDCSVQRNFQKFIEETPSSINNRKLLDEIKKEALKIFQFLKYDNVGTAEFLVDSNYNYYFLEINARIQVEHTITEVVSDIDIVEEQINISSGNSNEREKYILPNYYALECRINAEDPNNNFISSSGKVDILNLPCGRNIRVDSYIYQGYSLKPYYNSLLMKIITYDKIRDRAINKMQTCLDEIIISGVKTNIDFNYEIISKEDFKEGNYKFKKY